jgi:Cu/Ag efflux pump CusA
VVNLLIRLALEKRLTVIILSLVTMAIGAFVTLRMPVDVFPDLTAPTVTVLVEGHSLSPQEMETQVTFPIESAMNGASGVRRVRSGTALGITVVWVEFDWGTDIQRARQTVAERLSTISSAMPEGVEAPKLAPVSSVMGEILFLSLTSTRHTPLELRTTATTLVRRRLLSVPGVSQVTPIGGDTKQYQVLLAPDRMRAYGITADEVIDSLRGSNRRSSSRASDASSHSRTSLPSPWRSATGSRCAWAISDRS